MGGLARKKQIILFARLKHSPAPRANMKLVPVIEHTCHQPPAASSQLHKHSLRRNGSLFLFSILPTRRVLVLVVMVLCPTEWTSCVILKLIKAWMLDALVG